MSKLQILFFGLVHKRHSFVHTDNSFFAMCISKNLIVKRVPQRA